MGLRHVHGGGELFMRDQASRNAWAPAKARSSVCLSADFLLLVRWLFLDRFRPFAWLVMTDWLRAYPYRTDYPAWWIAFYRRRRVGMLIAAIDRQLSVDQIGLRQPHLNSLRAVNSEPAPDETLRLNNRRRPRTIQASGPRAAANSNNSLQFFKTDLYQRKISLFVSLYRIIIQKIIHNEMKSKAILLGACRSLGGSFVVATKKQIDNSVLDNPKTPF